MSHPLTSELSQMSIAPDSIDANGSHRVGDSSPVGRINPWKGRVVTSGSVKGVAENITGTPLQPQDRTGGSFSSEKLFEADAWPEPSAPFERRVTMAGSGSKTVDDKPKNKKIGRKWQNIEIEIPISRGGAACRGGVRMSSGVTNPNHHPSSSIPPSTSSANSAAPSTLPRGGGGGRRGGPTSNGAFNRARGGRPVNGYYQSRPPLRVSEQEGTHDSTTDISETVNPESVPKVVSTAAVFASGAPRGSYSSRGRRTSSRGGYANANYAPKNSVAGVPLSSPPVALPVPHQVSVAAAAAAQAMPQLPAVGPVAYLFPNMMMPAPTVFPMQPQALPTTTEAAVIDGGAPTMQAAVILPQPSPQACLVSPDPTPQAASNALREEVTLEELLEFINAYGWSRARMPDHFRKHPTVAAAMQAVGMLAATGDETVVGYSREDVVSPPTEKKEDIIVVDDKFYFVPLNSHLTKFLKFHSKQDYIRHHVEYYFSDVNLQRDAHLVKIICMNKCTCPVGALLGFNRLRYACTTEDELIEAVASSTTVNVVYDDQQKIIGVAPQNTSMLRDSSSASSVNYSTSFDATAQQSTQTPELPLCKSSDMESSQVLLHLGSIGGLPFILPNGAAAASVSSLQPNGGPFIPPNFLPCTALPPYYNANTLTGAVTAGAATGAAGDHTVTLSGGTAADAANVYYRPVWPATAVYPQVHTSFLPYITTQHQPLYVPLFQPPTAGLASAPSVHNVPRNPSAPFVPAPIAVSNAQLSSQQQRAYAVSVRAPHRPPSNRPISGDKTVDETLEQNS